MGKLSWNSRLRLKKTMATQLQQTMSTWKYLRLVLPNPLFLKWIQKSVFRRSFAWNLPFVKVLDHTGWTIPTFLDRACGLEVVSAWSVTWGGNTPTANHFCIPLLDWSSNRAFFMLLGCCSKPSRSLSWQQMGVPTSLPGTQCSSESGLVLLLAASPLPGPWLCCPSQSSSICSQMRSVLATPHA